MQFEAKEKNLAKKVLVPIADGIEEIEAVTIIDVLRRAGALVTVASVDSREIKASRGVRLAADVSIQACTNEEFDLIALPGGMPGAERLRDSTNLTQLLKRQKENGQFYAAICASPVVALQRHGLLEGRKATCHPSFAAELADNSSVESNVVVDGPCITGKGPGTAMEFSLKLVEMLYSRELAEKIAEAMAYAH